MPDQVPDIGERLHVLGRECSVLIRANAGSFSTTGRWLLSLPNPCAFGETEDRDDPCLRDGHWIIYQDPLSGEEYLYDDEDRMRRLWGEIPRRMICAWDAAAYRFRARSRDCFFDFDLEDAKRIILLAALTLRPDFSGEPLVFSWPWDDPEDSSAKFDGRGWAWSRITCGIHAEKALRELIEKAIDEFRAHGLLGPQEDESAALPTDRSRDPKEIMP